jgi:hypothetical protein
LSTKALNHTEIYETTFDARGFLWVATQGGLFRHDGSEFRSVKAPTQVFSSLSGFAHAPDSSIWMTDFSKHIFQLKNDVLQEWVPPKGCSFNRFPKLYFSPQNELLAVNLSGVNIFSGPNYQQWKHIELRSQNVLYFYKGLTFCPSEREIYLLDTKHGKHQTVAIDGQFKLLTQLSEVIFLEHSGQLFFTDNFGQKMYRWNGKGFETFSDLPDWGKLMKFVTIQGETWCCTQKGLYKIALENNRFVEKGHYFESKVITDIDQDREGTYWISTISEGLFKVRQFSSYLFNTTNSSLKDDIIMRVSASPKGVFLGTKLGHVYLYDGINFKVINAKNSKYEISLLQWEADKEQLRFANEVHYLYRNSRVDSISTSVGTSYFETHGAKSVRSTWVGVQLFTPGIDTIDFLKGLNTKSLACTDDFSIIWASTRQGLYFINGGKEKLVQLDGRDLYASHITRFGQYCLVATPNQGLLLYQMQAPDKPIKRFNKQNGLISNTIRRIILHEDQIWLLTADGVQVLDKQFKPLFKIDKLDGLDMVVNDLAIWQGKAFMATNLGLVLIEFDKFAKTAVKPLLGEIIVQSSQGNLPLENYYEFNQDALPLRIIPTSISFNNPDGPRIRYRIGSEKQAWNYLTRSGQAIELATLQLGLDSILVQAIDQDGTVLGEQRLIKFKLLPPIWLRWWFILLACALVGLLLWWFYRRQVSLNRKRDREVFERELLEKELRLSNLTALRSQMNPHFMFNALNTIQAYIFSNDSEAATYFLGNFAALMRKILDHSAKETINLSDEVSVLNLYCELEQMRFGGELNFHIEMDEHLKQLDPQLSPMVVQPFVENAIKHGLAQKKSNRELWIRFKEQDKKLLVEIEDNGIGRQKAAEIKARQGVKYNSYAVDANHKRLELLTQNINKEIVLEIFDLFDTEKQLALGTKVVLYMPLEA